LTAQLIGRPITKLMTPSYARLCLQYVGAVSPRRGALGLDEFTAEARGDPQTLAFAHRLQVIEDDNPDPRSDVPPTSRLSSAFFQSNRSGVGEIGRGKLIDAEEAGAAALQVSDPGDLRWTPNVRQSEPRLKV
jgi:hypothetical protein